ncbi:MAG: MnhB domain-containing protein [Chloroflexota bacterium]|nr:MnhB domain-containing protein [Chloroflexota bacterium]
MSTILTRTVARLLLLPTLVVAVAILAKGYSSTGDGFSAGVIAATGILLQYLAYGRRAVRRVVPAVLAPAAVAAGLLLALLVAFVPTLVGHAILTHAPAPDAPVLSIGTLEVHTAVLFDVGVFCLVFGFMVGVLDRIGRAVEDLTE